MNVSGSITVDIIVSVFMISFMRLICTRQVRLERARHEIAIALDEIVDAQEVVVDVAVERHRLARNLVELAARERAARSRAGGCSCGAASGAARLKREDAAAAPAVPFGVPALRQRVVLELLDARRRARRRPAGSDRPRDRASRARATPDPSQQARRSRSSSVADVLRDHAVAIVRDQRSLADHDVELDEIEPAPLRPLHRRG